MVEQIIQQIDALSVRMVVGESRVPDMVEALRSIETACRNAGGASAIEAAAELTARASGTPPGELPRQEFERVVTAGLENLRRALQHPAGTASPAAFNALAEDPELLGDFITEAREHMTAIEAQVLALERDPLSSDPLDAAFRSFHTIKGLAGFLDLGDIHAVSHEIETLLGLARNRELAVTPAVIDVVLEGADYLKRAIVFVEQGLRADDAPSGGAGAPPAFAQLLVRVRAVLDGSATSAPAPEPTKTEVPAASLSKDASSSWTLRVDANKFDGMVDMVGELVIAQSLITHLPELRGLESVAVQRSLQQLGRLAGEVQRIAMSMRMTPVGQLFNRLQRLVRDLARKNGKKVRLELLGEDTELDKSMIEQLVDPLMHMVRNSLDHGLEPPEERAAKGKPQEGRLLLSASHQAGKIVIEVTDDGRGLNTEKILRKARERGLVAEGQNPTQAEIFRLIFEPGFSTADQVTDVSGRGVGMDVVTRQIQGLRGRIDIQSAPNRGTTFQLRMPLTLAMIDGLIVRVGKERYILPVSAVREMLRPAPDMLFTMEGRAEMVLVRGEVLPIVRLANRFTIPGATRNPCEGLLVVAESQGRRFCLLVDEMLGKQEVVIKGLGETFRHVPGISGGAILSDGRVGLILNLNGVFKEKVDV